MKQKILNKVWLANAFLMGVAEANQVVTTSFYDKQADAYTKGRRLTHKVLAHGYQILTLSKKKPFRYDY